MRPWPRRWARGGGEPPAVRRALADLAEVVEYPATPDLASAVRERLAAGAAPAPGRRPAPKAWATVRVAVAVVLLAALVLVAFPGPRAAVARLWDLFGIEIGRGEVPSSLGAAPSTSAGQAPGANLRLGRPVGLEEAGTLAGGAIPVPRALGRPDAVWYAPLGEGSVVSLVYRARPGLAVSPHSGVGLLLSVITDPQSDVNLFFKKIDTMDARRATVDTFTDGGQMFHRISGPPHALYTGYPGMTDGRSAGNALLWRRGDRTYRLEAEVSREEALRLARSLG
jgi:hypothetical protein